MQENAAVEETKNRMQGLQSRLDAKRRARVGGAGHWAPLVLTKWGWATDTLDHMECILT